ncbi:MAG: segregation/condensation protein A [Candidatus Syntropharchaeia archaeon]
MEEPIEILVDLASKGEIDPWNIDIIEVTDKFLEKLEEMEKLDLVISGKTLLYASILLRMKSEMLFPSHEEEEKESPEEGREESEEYPILIPKIRREAKRPVTLEELIEELKKAEKVERRKKEREKRRKMQIEDIQIECVEGFEERMEKVLQMLNDKFKKVKVVSFSELTKELPVVSTYVSLLFLASRKKIWLEQEELFEELYIRRRDEGEKHP